MATAPAFPATPKLALAQILPADTTTKKTLITAAAALKITGLQFTSDDTSTRVVQIFVTRSAVDYLLGSISVTTLAGTDGAVAAKNGFDTTLLPGLPLDNDGQPYIFLENADVLKIAAVVAVTAGKTIHASAVYASF